MHGTLGAGKTTFVRGILEGLGYCKPVRSPTYNLIQVFDTQPPVMHSDLFRVKQYQGIGLEDYLDTHICFIEWPDRASSIVDNAYIINITFEILDEKRKITF